MEDVEAAKRRAASNNGVFPHTSLQADAACGHAEVKDLATRAYLFAAFVACVAYAIWYFALSNLGSTR